MPIKSGSKKIEKVAIRLTCNEAERLRNEARLQRITMSELIRQKLAAGGEVSE
jgi:uncharacterized protein with von Willebrand factor type A (vWA) domain